MPARRGLRSQPRADRAPPAPFGCGHRGSFPTRPPYPIEPAPPPGRGDHRYPSVGLSSATAAYTGDDDARSQPTRRSCATRSSARLCPDDARRRARESSSCERTRGGVYAVGGAVRDLLLGRRSSTSTSRRRATRSTSCADGASDATRSRRTSVFGTASVEIGRHLHRRRDGAARDVRAPGRAAGSRAGIHRDRPSRGATSP